MTDYKNVGSSFMDKGAIIFEITGTGEDHILLSQIEKTQIGTVGGRYCGFFYLSFSY